MAAPGGMRVSGVADGVSFGAGLEVEGGDATGSAPPPGTFVPLYERHPELPARPGVVTTVRGMGRTLEGWCRYHLALGFVKLYVYFDDPTELPALREAMRDDARLTLVPMDAAHRERWRSQRLWQKLGPHAESEVQARQELNGEHAVGLALRDKVTWLLHIDSDELFRCPDCTVQEHFERLTDDGVTLMNYVNYEGVPERVDVDDFFNEVTLFKRSLARVPQERFDMGGPVPCRRASEMPAAPEGTDHAAVKAALDFWIARSAHRQYFLGYENGKSAVAVVEGAVPLSVHEWMPPTMELFRRGRHNIRLLDSRGVLQYREDSACVLHYISCGFEWWWRKYAILGTFPDSWFGGALAIPPCFHLQSRDMNLAADREAARSFYERTVVLADRAEAERQIACGVLERLTHPRDTIAAATPSAPAPAAAKGLDEVDDEDEDDPFV